MSRKRDARSRKRFWLAAMVTLLACVAGAAAWYAWPYIEGDAEYASLREYTSEPADVESAVPGPVTESGAEAAGDPLMRREIDWEGLRKVNPDVIGWIYVPNTPIDYPVVQAPKSDPEKYLHTTFEGRVRYPNNEGTIYLDSSNTAYGWNSSTPLLYGHYQLNNSMFSSFSKNYEIANLKDHDQVYIYTPIGAMHLEIFAANAVNAATERIRTDFTDKGDLDAWMHAKLDESEAVAYDPGAVDQLFTFCVCSYNIWKNQRTLSYARVVEDTMPDDREMQLVEVQPEQVIEVAPE